MVSVLLCRIGWLDVGVLMFCRTFVVLVHEQNTKTVAYSVKGDHDDNKRKDVQVAVEHVGCVKVDVLLLFILHGESRGEMAGKDDRENNDQCTRENHGEDNIRRTKLSMGQVKS